MRISLNWINDYVDIHDVEAGWLADRFTVTTAEVEAVHHFEDDIIIEIDNKSLTNRPDLWCHYGIAREISAITGRRLKDLDYIVEEELRNNSRETLDIKVEDKEKCLRYSAIRIDNVKIAESPEFISSRLTNCGIRPINIIVDLANYVMLDVGQPLHTFDKSYANSLRVASYRELVELKCLDGVERKLPKDSLIIWNNEKPLAIAGIMGGEESAVWDNTEGIVLESATFDGVSIRKTASALGMRTDASIRYEKFLDTGITTIALGRFLKLLKQYQPEMSITSNLYDNIINGVKPAYINIEHRDIETYLGNVISRNTVINILKNLQFGVVAKGSLYVIKVPSFRATKDITCKADIIEEILRSYGYDKIKGKPMVEKTVGVLKDPMKGMEYLIKDILVKKFNFNEVHSYSWYDNNWLRKLGYDYEDTLKIVNTSVKQYDKLRSDITPNMLKIIYDNRKNYEKISIFELGRIFCRNRDGLIQPKHLTAAVYSSDDEEQAYRHLKGICDYILRTAKNIEAKYIPVKNANKDNCLSVTFRNTLLGYIYSIPSSVMKLYGGGKVINIIDIDLERLGDVKGNEIKYAPVSKYPETYLDFSILTPDDMPYIDLESLINKFMHPLIIQKNLIGIYAVKDGMENLKSTTIRIVIGDKNRTLMLEEISQLKDLFIKHLNENGLELR